jgi:hypothetical protein
VNRTVGSDGHANENRHRSTASAETHHSAWYSASRDAWPAKTNETLGFRKSSRPTNYLLRPSSLSGGSTTSRPSTGNAFSSTLKPIPSLCGKAAPILGAHGDKLAGVLDSIHGDGFNTTEESAVLAGARYVAPPTPFEAFSLSSGRLVTGANPASAHITVLAAISAFDMS